MGEWNPAIWLVDRHVQILYWLHAILSDSCNRCYFLVWIDHSAKRYYAGAKIKISSFGSFQLFSKESEWKTCRGYDSSIPQYLLRGKKSLYLKKKTRIPSGDESLPATARKAAAPPWLRRQNAWGHGRRNSAVRVTICTLSTSHTFKISDCTVHINIIAITVPHLSHKMGLNYVFSLVFSWFFIYQNHASGNYRMHDFLMHAPNRFKT